MSDSPGSVIHINNDWSAVILNDGRVIMQHRKGYVMGSGQEVDLSLLSQPGHENMANQLAELGSHRLLIRCAILSSDGSIEWDIQGISPGGIPEKPFAVLAPAAEGAGSYMVRNQKNFEADMADPNY